LYKEIIDQFEQNLDYIKNRYQSGYANEYDYIRIDLQYNQYFPIYNAISDDIDNEKRGLLSVLGIYDYTNIIFSGEFFNLTNKFSQKIDILSIDSGENFSNDLNLLDLHQEVSNSKHNQRMVFLSTLPQIDTYFNYNVDYINDYTKANSKDRIFSGSWNAGARVSLFIDDLLPWSQKKAQIDELKVRDDLVQYKIKEIIQENNSEIKNIVIKMSILTNNYKYLDKSMKLSKKGFEIANKMFRSGGLSILELTDALVSYNKTKESYIQYIYDYYYYYLKLKKVYFVI